MTGVLYTARISTAEVIMSSDKWIKMVNFVLGNEMLLNFFAFNVFRHAVESSTPSFSFFTLTVWNACQKRETYLKRHASLYVNCHF